MGPGRPLPRNEGGSGGDPVRSSLRVSAGPVQTRYNLGNPPELEAEDPELDEYTEFISRVRAGDEQAAEELVRRYESEIRVEVRVWLRMHHPQLRRVFDSMDICQSVLASFFVRAAVGDFDLEEPRQLVQLLIGMARNKLLEQVRHHHRQRRDVRRVVPSEAADAVSPAAQETPSQVVSRRELLQKLRERLNEDERRLADLRAQGLDWAAVAGELGGTAEGRRKQLSRAIERAGRELGFDSQTE